MLQCVASEHAPTAFANSVGAEDMVLMDLLCKHAPAIEIFTLKTVRLHGETYQIMHDVRSHCGVHIKICFPDREAIENYLAANGPPRSIKASSCASAAATFARWRTL